MQLLSLLLKCIVGFFFIAFLASIHSDPVEAILFISLILYLVIFLYVTRSFIPLLYCTFIFLTILFPWFCVRLDIGTEFMTWYTIQLDAFTLLYINTFILIVVSSFCFFKFFFNNEPLQIFSWRFRGIFIEPKFILILFLFISVLADIGLYQLGTLIMISQEFVTSPFASFLKMLSSFKLMALLYAGYLMQEPNRDKMLRLIYFFVLIPYPIAMGIFTGSRFTTLLPLAILMYSHINFFLRYSLILIASLPTIMLIFPILNVYRGMEEKSLSLAIDQALQDLTLIGNLLAVALDRFVSLGPINNVIISTKDNIVYHSDYLYNFVGMIPRFLWPNKPSPLDTNLLGVELGMIFPDNYTTSISIDIIGESFYQLGYFGLTIAIVQGLIFWFLDNKIGYKSAAGYILLFLGGVTILGTSTYVNILPTIILTIFLPLPFLWILNSHRLKD